MEKYKDLPFNKRQEELVDIMCAKTGSEDRNFFRVMVSYKFAEMATNMRATVEYLGTKGIPTNMYALDLAPSGYSKNASMNLLEKEIFREFKDKFMLKTMPEVSSKNLALLADDLSLMLGIDVGDAALKMNKEYDSLPKYLYSFGASTPEGFKAMRAKLSMAGLGATSNVVDEIGSNLSGNQDTMVVQLEAYDMGDSKQKLIKVDSNSDLRGSVPSNLFAFGTQSKLLDGAFTEKAFFDMLETGYARRFIIGFVEGDKRDTSLTAEDMYDQVVNPTTDATLKVFSKYFGLLADETNIDKSFGMTKEVALRFIDYRIQCDKLADGLKDHEEIFKAVTKHSYWRALKIAGAYAFINGHPEINDTDADNAFALIEEGNRSFRAMLKREKPYVRLANYVADIGKKITQIDLIEDLPFYRGSESQKRELMNLAVAYGYGKNIIIKRTIKDGIEFLEGEKLKETDVEKVTLSWSGDIAKGYKPTEVKFDSLHQMVSGDGYHYCSHSFTDGHRISDKAIKGFNLLILDVDSGLPIETCKVLLKDYKFLIATTKRHTPDKNRYRIVLPMSHELLLDKDEYKKFMKNVFEWLPFDSDEQTSDIARKWASHKGEHWYNEGKLIDVLPFIPDTPKEVAYRETNGKYTNIESLQRWFLMNNKDQEGRNNCCRDYALALLDNGLTSDNIRHSVFDLNSKFDSPLPESELERTVLKTVIRKEMELELDI